MKKELVNDETLPDLETSVGAPRPVVVIAGRPNVGKSTLVNRIVGRRIAIVEEQPGVTRDSLELAADWRGRDFLIVDTGGVVDRGDSLDRKVTEKALRAAKNADVILFLLDATTGITVEDEVVASLLRRFGSRVLIIANKVDSEKQETDAWEFSRLGFGDPVAVSAIHGRGIGDLLDIIVGRFPPEPGEESEPTEPPERPGQKEVAAIAIVGRPNVGKSTLFNRLVGDERTIVHDLPGTTRDAIDTVVETDLGLVRFIDTAGLRRKSRIGQGSEYYSLVRSLSAIDRADVAVLVIDSIEGVTHQEQRLAERVDAAGSPIVILLNKWDALTTEQRLAVTRDVDDRLAFLSYAPTLRASALTGQGIHRLLPALRAAIDAYHHRIPTAQLNEALKSAQAAHPPPAGRILYGVQGAIDPPTFTLFTSRRLPPTYMRYLERILREKFKLGPTPLKLRVRVRGQ
jgi:GTP-binding protein